MKTVFYSKDAQFLLEDEEFEAFMQALAKGAKRVMIPRLQVFLSDLFVWAGEKPNDVNVGRLRDGTKIVKRAGRWVDAVNPDVVIDPHYYPEIARDEVMSEEEWKRRQAVKKPDTNLNI